MFIAYTYIQTCIVVNNVYDGGMDTHSSISELHEWRTETRRELERARTDLADAQKRMEKAQERLELLDQLLALEEHKSIGEVKDAQEEPVALLDACEEVLREAGQPLHIKELQTTLLERGVPLPGRGTEANLIVRRQRSDGRFIRTGRGTYGLPEFGVPEARPVRRRKAPKQRRSNG